MKDGGTVKLPTKIPKRYKLRRIQHTVSVPSGRNGQRSTPTLNIRDIAQRSNEGMTVGERGKVWSEEDNKSGKVRG